MIAITKENLKRKKFKVHAVTDKAKLTDSFCKEDVYVKDLPASLYIFVRFLKNSRGIIHVHSVELYDCRVGFLTYLNIKNDEQLNNFLRYMIFN
jgi:hypothetical protein